MIASLQPTYGREAGRSGATQCMVMLFALLLFLTPTSLRAADPSPPVWQGVWRGTVPGAKNEWQGCVTGGLEAHGADGYLDQTLAPTLITARWLGAALTQEDDCGGAHPNNSTVPVTFDRATGVEVDLHAWLNDAALDRSQASADLPPTVRPSFRRLIMANAGDLDADCREALANEEFWDIGLDRRGLTFRPELPHVVAVCADDELVPWATLARFLTPAGRAGRASLATR